MQNINEEVIVQDINYLQPMKVNFSCSGEAQSKFVFLNPILKEIYDCDFNRINDTKLGQAILDRIQARKTSMADRVSIPAEIIEKMMKVSQSEASKVTGMSENFYGEN